MNKLETNCIRCQKTILQTTADKLGGKCKPCSTGTGFLSSDDRMELGTRFLFGFFFAALFGSTAFSTVIFFGYWFAVLTALPASIFGFLVGFFVSEIKSLFKFLLTGFSLFD